MLLNGFKTPTSLYIFADNVQCIATRKKMGSELTADNRVCCPEVCVAMREKVIRLRLASTEGIKTGVSFNPWAY